VKINALYLFAFLDINFSIKDIFKFFFVKLIGNMKMNSMKNEQSKIKAVKKGGKAFIFWVLRSSFEF
jgi:hypothetical protein